MPIFGALDNPIETPGVTSSTKKCEHCGRWTDGTKAFCSHCGEMLDMQYRKERHEWEQSQQQQGPLMTRFTIRNSSSNPMLRAIEKLVQGGQAILIGIIAFVTFILVIMPG